MSIESSGRWGELVLLWLWSQRGDGPHAGLVKALTKAARAVPAEEATARIESALAELSRDRLVEQREGPATAAKGKKAKGGEGEGPAKKVSGAHLSLTDAGNERALHLQGLDRIPRKLDFASAQARWLSLAALGVAKDKLPKQRGFLAALLRERLGLAVKPGASANAVRDAIAWRELGVETDRPFTAAAVTGYLLSKRIGADRPLSADKAMSVLAAKEVGAASPTNDQIKHATLARLLSGAAAQSGAPPAGAAGAAVDDAAFAGRVLAAAAGCADGKFDEHHVFIARLFDHLAARGEAEGLDLDGFKARLVDANRARLLTLSRADFVEAMSPEDVRRSEVRYHSATFHFIRL